MQRIVLVFLLLVMLNKGYAQQTNTDSKQSYVTVNTPKTPESAAFEKYGNTQVNEFTGTTNVSLPFYTLKSRFLEAPIALSYQATGIKVNQEASWVGLGFDLIAGGRITVETHGSIDFCGLTAGLSSPTNLAAGMQQVFTRLGNSGENAVLTLATLCATSTCPNPDYDNYMAISEMTQFGTGEPDIFRANFMGHSVSFYIDKISHTIKFLGEQSLFTINYTLDSYNNITSWSITDNMGVVYTFNQTETTTNTIPGNAVIPATSVSAWLLTRAEHPTGDYIQYTYSNYGYSVPAFTMNGSVMYQLVSGSATVSSDQFQNISLQSPYYLTRMESSSVAVDFSLATRTDLYGPGSRKLTQITVTDKQTNQVKKKALFNYSYFQSSYNPWSSYLNNLSYYLPSPLTTSGYIACSSSRLRLDSVNMNDNNYEPPYKFYYNGITVDKYSYGQDHWNYYNAVGNHSNGYGFAHLIPFSGTGGVGNIIPSTYLNSTQIGYNRECDSASMQAMIVTKVVYPTGGSTEFTYEPHKSVMLPTYPLTGGGLRVKTVKNYSLGSTLTGTTEYAYANGKYMGTIQYYTSANQLQDCGTGNVAEMKYSTGGAINFNDILVGYGQVTVTQKDSYGRSNGSLVKTFNTSTSSSNYSNNTGFDIAPPVYGPQESPTSIDGYTYDMWLDARYKGLPPTPSANLEGKLMQEQYLDNSNNLLKSVNYYYRLANYTNSFYNIKAIQNRLNGFNSSCAGNTNGGFGSGGNRPVILFVSPAKSFHALIDSVVERTYSGNSYITRKTSTQYNAYYQPMFTSEYNSDGTQTINYTRTSAEVYVPLAGPASGDIATNMYQMMQKHILDLPIEQVVIKRGTAGDSSVIGGRFNVYQNALPLKVYALETQQPLVFRSQFMPWYYDLSAGSSYSAAIDNHFSLSTTADYSANNYVWTLHTQTGDKAFVWDEFNNCVLAQCTNTDSANIAFSSFESTAQGRWSYGSGGVIADNTSPTGNNAYNLSYGNISLGSLSSATSYIVSYWSKTGSSYSITGSVSVKQGKTINGWTYFEHAVSGSSGVTVSGGGRIDELRLYPSTAQMTSFTYVPLFGIGTQCDENNRISYYSYDTIGRLKLIKDQDGNILKTFQYHFQSVPGVQ